MKVIKRDGKSHSVIAEIDDWDEIPEQVCEVLALISVTEVTVAFANGKVRTWTKEGW